MTTISILFEENTKTLLMSKSEISAVIILPLLLIVPAMFALPSVKKNK